jgi:hypothetical protein
MHMIDVMSICTLRCICILLYRLPGADSGRLTMGPAARGFFPTK